MLRPLVWTVGLLYLVGHFFSALSFAADSSVIVGVGDTVMLVQGQTSPSAFVTIKDGGVVTGTVTADDNGVFSRTFTAQSPGIHNIEVSAADSKKRQTDPVTQAVNVQQHFTTSAYFFLPPTLALSTSQISPGQRVDLSGETAPGASVTIILDDTTNLTTGAKQNTGEWIHRLDTRGLKSGQHSIYVKSRIGSNQSNSSAKRFFQIASTTLSSASTSISPPSVPRITSPQNGTTATSRQLVVEGQAETGTQIEVWLNGQPAGSVFADTSGKWRLTVNLNQSSNRLQALACRQGVCSQLSEAITVSFSVDRLAGPSLILDSYKFFINDSRTVKIHVNTQGGEAPYRVVVDWGDGQAQTIESQAASFEVAHTYEDAGKYSGQLTITDAEGQATVAPFSVEVDEAAIKFKWVPWLFGGLAGGILMTAFVRFRLRPGPPSPSPGGGSSPMIVSSST